MESIVSNERNRDSDKGKSQEGPHEMTLISKKNSLECMVGENDEVDHGLIQRHDDVVVFNVSIGGSS